MIESIFLNTHRRYVDLPLLGPLADDFVQWLSQCDYPRQTIRVMLGPIGQVDQWLRSQDIDDITELDIPVMEACWTHFYRRSSGQGRALGSVIRALERYLEAKELLRPTPPQSLTPSQRLLAT